MPTSAQSLSYVLLFAAPWTVAQQAPLSMGFSQKEYLSELSFPPPGIFLIQGSKSPASPALAGGFFTTEPPGKPIRSGLSSSSSAKLLQSCPTLCNTMDCILPGSSVHGMLQARILE